MSRKDAYGKEPDPDKITPGMSPEEIKEVLDTPRLTLRYEHRCPYCHEYHCSDVVISIDKILRTGNPIEVPR